MGKRLINYACISVYAFFILLIFLTSCAIQKSSSTQYDNRLDQFLLASIEGGSYEEVLDLLGRGANPNARDSYGRTALMYAGITGQTDIMEVLIEKGAQINAKDKAGVTPLHAAIMFGDPNAIRLLINEGADVNTKFYLGPNTRELSPLGLANWRYQNASEKRMSDELARGRLIFHAIKSDFQQIIQMLEDVGAIE